MTVEADQVRVESRLVARQVDCPDCRGALRPWGWARPRGVRGIAGVLRPRRARCPGCGVTHVLLPVTVLARRAYASEVLIGQPTLRQRLTRRTTPPPETLLALIHDLGVPGRSDPNRRPAPARHPSTSISRRGRTRLPRKHVTRALADAGGTWKTYLPGDHSR
jgi:hypothetical protein